MIGPGRESLQQHFGTLSVLLRDAANSLTDLADSVLEFADMYDYEVDRDDSGLRSGMIPHIDRVIERVNSDLQSAVRQADLMTRP